MAGRRRAWLQLAVFGLIVGVLGVTQFKTQLNITKELQTQSPVNQAQTISNLLESNSALAQQVRSLQGQLDKYSQGSTTSGLETLVSDVNRFKVANGLVEVWGPGVEVTVSGTRIKPEDVHDIINELRNAGAEALSLNGQRLVTNSVVMTDDAGGLRLDGTALTAPYVFQAIGDTQTMEVALERKGGIVSLLRFTYADGSIGVRRVTRMALPIFQGSFVYRFAKPAD